MEPRPLDKLRWSCWQGAVGSEDPLDYILLPEELRRCGFPAPELPGYASAALMRDGEPRLVGLDCEMVKTTEGLALARVSLVGLGGAVLYDALVGPEAPVLDYLTEHSGLCEELLRGVTRTALQARQEVLDLLHLSDILCGHDLSIDLHALKLSHARVIDSQLLYPHPDGPPSKSALEKLCAEHLHRRIQQRAHSSIEDATAVLELLALRLARRQGRLFWEPLLESTHDEATPTLRGILTSLRLAESDVACVYLRGSRAVGYAGLRPDGHPSDWDFVIVMRHKGAALEGVHMCYGSIEASLYDEHTFARLLRDCTVWVLECIFAPPRCIYKQEIEHRALFAALREQTPRAVLHAKLRRSVSYESGRKWSKAKRQLRQGEQSGRKQMFIALRFLVYGIELARHGVIQELSCANHIWERLSLHADPTWEALRATFEPLYKELRARLHQEAPRERRYAGPRLHLWGAKRAERLSPSPAHDVKQDSSEHPLATIQLLRAHEDPGVALEALRQRFQIQLERHAQYPQLVQLRYSPRSTPRAHPIVRECRGLIVDASEGFGVVAYPFARFFDLNEGVDDLDWSSAQAFEKLDGSLAILYWYDGEWRVASSRRPDASGLMAIHSAEGGASFASLFWEIWRREGYQLPPDEERRCYLFELTTRRHPIVVRYAEERLTLIGARALLSFQEEDPQPLAARFGWRSLRPLFEETGDALRQRLIREASQLDASVCEGFVVRDASFRRLKMKSPDYLRMTWMFPLCPTRERLNKRHLLRAVLSGESHELSLYCPEFRPEIDEARSTFESLCRSIGEVFDEIKDIDDPAVFARRAREHRFSDVLFGMKKQRRGVHEVLQDLPLKRVERWLSA